ncbi:4'-phosphopantetheinyl transferase family protein [Vibrio ostreicida]|uniref:Enterobactin synthase component D n=1 Tax=Vibrio ostreicida TaxID=526588 RepID=A0ABT8BVI0_9VIBR|nr:4'-phosphopantetheinyl transferase superfamily protein [Vibrio ostreicida]MDN3610394.1 4'-phosphopantetheinyl transferase superfamily protein [Vibrio ostreicida]NPD07596.1 4'-phosphopantetheinyl transferase superfamily protein [Vibrio ostreicida]
MHNDTFLQAFGPDLSITPAHAISSRARFDVTNFHSDSFSDYGIVQPQALLNAVDKRRSEYLAGRYVANDALKELTDESYSIPTGADRAPIWPAGITGSITHNEDQAIAVVAYSRDHSMIGVDLESLMSAPLAQELAPHIIDHHEAKLIKRLNLDFSHGLSVVFSAKESLYKALYPHVRTFFGFEDARVEQIDVSSGQFQITLLRDLNTNFAKGWQASGRFLTNDNTVVTLIADGL